MIALTIFFGITTLGCAWHIWYLRNALLAIRQISWEKRNKPEINPDNALWDIYCFTSHTLGEHI